MKTNFSFFALSIAFVGLCLVPPPVAAISASLLEMSEKADQSDKQDLQGALNQANSCTQTRNFSCSEEQLRKAANLVNSSWDRQALNSATQNLQAEKQKVKDEAIAEAEERRRQREAREAEERREEVARAEKRRRDAEDDTPAYRQPSLYETLQQGLNEASARLSANNRQTQRLYAEAMQNKQEQAQARQREANEAQARENERIRRQNQARQQQEQDRQQAQDRRHAQDLQQQEQDRQQALARQQEQERQQAQARQQQQDRQQAVARQQEQDRKAAEAAAAKLAEQQAKAQAEKQYLSAMTRGIRLGVKNCYGSYEVGGQSPHIKPEAVSCIDVHYRARCDGSAGNYDGVFKNFTGFDAGCFGDTATISPKPSCPIEQVRIQVVEVRGCGS